MLGLAWKRFVREEAGATMVEYGLILALITVICLAAVTSIGNTTLGLFNSIAASI